MSAASDGAQLTSFLAQCGVCRGQWSAIYPITCQRFACPFCGHVKNMAVAYVISWTAYDVGVLHMSRPVALYAALGTWVWQAGRPR